MSTRLGRAAGNKTSALAGAGLLGRFRVFGNPSLTCITLFGVSYSIANRPFYV